MKIVCTALILMLVLHIKINSQEIDVPILPSPQVISHLDGSFNLAKKLKIITKQPKVSKSDLSFTAGLIKTTLKDFNKLDAEIIKEIQEEKGTSEKGSSRKEISVKGAIVLSLQEAPKSEQPKALQTETNEEGYKLIISKSGVIISSISPKGLLYGAMSLIQLLEKAESNKLAAMEISDWPEMKFRGISDDISRGQVPNIENFKKIIRFMARYKMNTYMPYLEDMLRFEGYPSIGVNRGALTKEEVKELVGYAAKYYIDVIPAFQTLGHYENILSQEEFLKYAEFPGAASLCVSNDSTYKFLEGLLKEVCEMFPSEYFNMGADESYDVGLGKSKYLVDKSSLAMVHLEHYKKVYDILKKSGKKVMMYGDILLRHPEIIKELPKDITIIDWHYRADYDYPSTRTFQSEGIPYIVSPSVWNFTSTFPVNMNAVPNIKYITSSGLKCGSIGMINSNWGDFGAETIKELCYFGYAWSAQCAWNFKKSDENIFAKSFFYDFFGINDIRLASLYETLNSTLNQVTWHEFWRHPLLPQKEPAWWEGKISPVVKMSWMETTLPKAEADIKDLQISVKKNKDHFDVLKLVVDLSNFYRAKLLSQSLLSNKISDLYATKEKMGSAAVSSASGDENDEKFALALIDRNISSLTALKEEYRNTWLKYYKKDNLQMIEDKFDRLAEYFRETKQQLSRGKLEPAMIKSDWIYCKINDTTFAKSARFTKSFSIGANPQSAFIQFLGDTHAKLYINDQYVDQVFEKRSLSLWTEYKRIKFLDITKYLKKGENTIRVDVENYLQKGFAGFNLIADIKTNGESIQLLSDTSWTAQNTSEVGNSTLTQAIKRDYQFIVTAPNFETKRTSWIER
ncbi:MAG: family 20 glycosylhydrolase [Bacteroidota bacterium]|nr:family 20 glycosylhydrolase [Bacteroidota bacterium]